MAIVLDTIRSGAKVAKDIVRFESEWSGAPRVKLYSLGPRDGFVCDDGLFVLAATETLLKDLAAAMSSSEGKSRRIVKDLDPLVLVNLTQEEVMQKRKEIIELARGMILERKYACERY